MNRIRPGIPEYVHPTVAVVHVRSGVGISDHAKYGRGVGEDDSTTDGRDVVAGGRMDNGSVMDMVLVLANEVAPDLEERAAADGSVPEY